MKSVWRRRGDVALPVGLESHEALMAHREGVDFIAETRAARNIRQLRMFWALCQILSDNDEHCSTKELAKKNLLYALNYIEIWVDRAGLSHVQPASIRCESMPQEEFNQFFQVAVAKICEWLGTAPDDIRKRVDEIVNPAKGHVWR